MSNKANVLLVGSGGVGILAAYNLEVGGLASVTSVLRSNYDAVSRNGFTITSLDHGYVKGWKPSTSKEPPILMRPANFPPSSQLSARCGQGRSQAIRFHCRHHQEYCRCLSHGYRDHCTCSNSRRHHHCASSEWFEYRETTSRCIPDESSPLRCFSHRSNRDITRSDLAR